MSASSDHISASVRPGNYHPHLASGRSALAVFGVLWSSLHTLIPTLSSALVFFVSALYLTPSDFGLVGLAASLVMSVIAFSPAAFGEALVQRSDLNKAHTDSVFWLTTGFAAVTFLPIVLGSGAIAGWLGTDEIAPLLAVLALRIPLDLMAAVPNAMILRAMKFKLLAIRTAIATLVSVTLCLGMLFAGFGYWALVASQVSASLVTCLMAFAVSGWRPGISLKITAIRDLSSYGIFASGNRMLSTIKLDHLVLGVLAGPQALGLFVFAQRLFQMLTQLIGGTLSSVTLSLLSTLQGEPEKTAKAFAIASFTAAALSVPMFTMAGILAPDVIALALDPKWQGSAFLVQGFCVVGVLAGISVVQAALLNSQGKARWWFYYQLIQQSSSVLVIALTYSFGLHVMMIILIAKTIAVWPLSAYLTARLLDRSVWSYLSEFRVPVFASLVMAAGMLGLKLAAPDWSGVPLLIAQIGLGALIYLPIIAYFSRDRLAMVLKIISAKGHSTP